MSQDSSAEYYQDNKERYQSLEQKTNESNNMDVNDIKTSLKMKKKKKKKKNLVVYRKKCFKMAKNAFL